MANPLYHGDYPEIMKVRIANRSSLEGYTKSRLPVLTEDEKKTMKGTSDFFAFNTYWSYVVVNIKEPNIINPPNRENDVGVANAGGKVNENVSIHQVYRYLKRYVLSNNVFMCLI